MARGGIHHVGFSVSDLARSDADFYAPVLGFLGYQRVGDAAGRLRFWRDPQRGPTLHLVQAEGAAEPPEADHCAFSVESRGAVDRLHALLLDRGIQVMSAPADYPHFGPGHYALFFRDPDGRLFEVLYRPSAPDREG